MIAIVKYNAGNIRSVQNALNRLGVKSTITNNPEELHNASHVIIPGVGQANWAMNDLKANGLDKVLPELKQPVLGICLGLQLLCESSTEGPTDGLGIFKTKVLKFPEKERVPHMGWNELQVGQSKLLKGIASNQDFYFVHSYYAQLCDATAASCNYITPFSAVLEKDNFFATQFHPEKSATPGAEILKNFLAL